MEIDIDYECSDDCCCFDFNFDNNLKLINSFIKLNNKIIKHLSLIHI